MGTITIYEYHAIGGNASTDGSPVYNLNALTKRTQDATTSTSAETITLRDDTNYVRIEAEELHRVSMVTDKTADNYEEIPPASETPLGRDFAVKGGQAIYYRADA